MQPGLSGARPKATAQPFLKNPAPTHPVFPARTELPRRGGGGGGPREALVKHVDATLCHIMRRARGARH